MKTYEITETALETITNYNLKYSKWDSLYWAGSYQKMMVTATRAFENARLDYLFDAQESGLDTTSEDVRQAATEAGEKAVEDRRVKLLAANPDLKDWYEAALKFDMANLTMTAVKMSQIL